MRRRWLVVASVLLVSGVASVGAWYAGEEAAVTDPPPRAPDVMFLPTPHDVVDAMLELASVRAGDVVCDLGCGDGRIVVAAAQRYGCRAVGYDIDRRRVEESRARARRARVEHLVTVEQKDLYQVDASGASVVTLYLLPNINVRLIPQLEKLKPGSRIVSHNYDMAGVEPDKVVQMTSQEDAMQHTLYLWTAPLRKAGKG